MPIYKINLLMEVIMISYDRNSAVEYAHKWAFKRNPNYLNFDNLGGDCTNFASQVLYAGSHIMNYTPVYGWYYNSSDDRTASWTGVEYLYNFLVTNQGNGPFGEEIDVNDINIGDIIQLSFDGEVFRHSPVVVRVGNPVSINNILIAAHSYDRDNYNITNYIWKKIRFIHIIGVR